MWAQRWALKRRASCFLDLLRRWYTVLLFLHDGLQDARNSARYAWLMVAAMADCAVRVWTAGFLWPEIVDLALDGVVQSYSPT